MAGTATIGQRKQLRSTSATHWSTFAINEVRFRCGRFARYWIPECNKRLFFGTCGAVSTQVQEDKDVIVGGSESSEDVTLIVS